MYQKQFITERLIIREYHKRDLDDFLSVIRQPQVYATTYGIPLSYSKARGKWWFKVIRYNRHHHMAYEYAVFLRDSGRYIGNVGLINMDHTHHHADISYYMDHAVTGQGYATEAAAAMLQYGFLTLGFHKINGVCMHKNGASRRVMEKIGMRYEGTLREDLYKDGVYYDPDRLSILDEEYYTLCKAKKTSFQHLNVESV